MYFILRLLCSLLFLRIVKKESKFDFWVGRFLFVYYSSYPKGLEEQRLGQEKGKVIPIDYSCTHST